MELIKYDPKKASTLTQYRMSRALDIAKHSGARQRHGALLMQSNRTLSVGVNTSRNHGGLEGAHPRFTSLHAEVAATKLHAEVPNTVLYLARLGAHNGFLPSPPCKNCLEWLKKYTQVRRVIYS